MVFLKTSLLLSVLIGVSLEVSAQQSIDKSSFESAIKTLREKTEVPLRLPTLFSSPSYTAKEKRKPLLAFVRAEKHSFELKYCFSDSCHGAYYYGVVSGEKISPKLEEPFGVPVKLAQGINGIFQEGSCGASCGHGWIFWDQGGYRYVVGLNLDDDVETLTKFANSAINNASLLLSATGLTQTGPLSSKPIATKFRIAGPKYSRGILYITVDGKERKIADVVGGAWIINGGSEVVYSSHGGAGGYENEGETLHIYNVENDGTREILSEYYFIVGITEVKLSTGAIALLVRMMDGGLGASYLAVVDPLRGEVLFRRWAELTEINGDAITLALYRDWETINEQRSEEPPREATYSQGAIPQKPNVRPYKTETYDLKKILKNKVICNKPDDRSGRKSEC